MFLDNVRKFNAHLLQKMAKSSNLNANSQMKRPSMESQEVQNRHLQSTARPHKNFLGFMLLQACIIFEPRKGANNKAPE